MREKDERRGNARGKKGHVYIEEKAETSQNASGILIL
jgi:hypothetical protein